MLGWFYTMTVVPFGWRSVGISPTPFSVIFVWIPEWCKQSFGLPILSQSPIMGARVYFLKRKWDFRTLDPNPWRHQEVDLRLRLDNRRNLTYQLRISPSNIEIWGLLKFCTLEWVQLPDSRKYLMSSKLSSKNKIIQHVQTFAINTFYFLQ